MNIEIQSFKTSLLVLLNKKISFVTSGMMIYYKTHLFPFSEVNMEKRLQTFYVLLLPIITSYLYTMRVLKLYLVTPSAGSR